MNVRPYYIVEMNVPFLSSVSDDFYNGYIMGLSDAAGFTKEQALKLFDYGADAIAVYCASHPG